MAILSVNEATPGESAPFLTVFLSTGAAAENQVHLFLKDVTPEEMHRLGRELEAAQTNHRKEIIRRRLAFLEDAAAGGKAKFDFPASGLTEDQELEYSALSSELRELEEAS